ncbi:MAG: hypothetical protein WCX79_00485 [Candidatus Paceibacterota bacterium]|jgi:hypothetical protein
MYNGIKRCSNYEDVDATIGLLHLLFGEVQYGYYFNSRIQKPGFLKYSMYFTTPFDNIAEKEYGDHNGFCKEEHKTFEKWGVINGEKTKDLMQHIPLQYDDHSPAVSYDCNHGNQFDRVTPTYKEAITRNIWFNNTSSRGFFEQFKRKNRNQILEDLERSMLYQVTFDIPFDVLSEHIVIDKIQYNGENESHINLYAPKDTSNPVQELLRDLVRVESVLTEMANCINEIKSDPEKYKRDNTEDSWAKECCKDGYNMENAEVLLTKCQKAFKQMEEVLYQARYFDVNAEPKISDITKCAHKKCTRNAAEGSKFCDQCIQLPTKECNYCEVGKFNTRI